MEKIAKIKSLTSVVYDIIIIRAEAMFMALETRERRESEGGKIVSEVHVKDNESLDSALKRFKRNCAKSGVLSDLRKKEYYQSPSVKRRKKSEAARKNKNKKYN